MMGGLQPTLWNTHIEWYTDMSLSYGYVKEGGRFIYTSGILTIGCGTPLSELRWVGLGVFESNRVHSNVRIRKLKRVITECG
jgi:hypothetical protein